MKTMKLCTVLFAVCFLVGAGLTAVTPAESVATDNPCNTDCWIITCWGEGTCDPGYVPYVKRYAWALVICEFASYTCNEVQIGCGFPC